MAKKAKTSRKKEEQPRVLEINDLEEKPVSKKKHSKILTAILMLIAAFIAICILILLLPKAVDNTPKDLSDFSGFYKISYNEGYNFAYKDASDGCDYTYKGIILRDGDHMITARVLSNIRCVWCGKNETMELPETGSKVVVDIEGVEGNVRANMAFAGKLADLRDFQVIQ